LVAIERGDRSGFVDLIERYDVRHVLYGHLHGAASHQQGPTGTRNGVTYHLVSADYVGFRPVPIG